MDTGTARSRARLLGSGRERHGDVRAARERRDAGRVGTGARQRDRIIDESVLYRVIGDEEIMREQLLPLAQRAGRRHVTLLVLPLDSGTYGECAGDRGSMNLVETPAHEHLVHLEPTGREHADQRPGRGEHRGRRGRHLPPRRPRP
ncbi:Scr1 family TA system antitoxin-like transcriptional regulator [Streptomyces griseus]|uniref:Scr1 family TA system antitoxin-like transcriptional regulator n=1 Tax=Streptomyces griseus TaxID=1911 RepID=UPI0027DF1B81|nr:Scr1 family TA system antitoxin-like transcriptional regulator [Streptomyces griseus]